MDKGGHLRLLGGIIAGDDRGGGIPLKLQLRLPQRARSGVLPLLDRGEGGVQHIKEAARGIELQKTGPQRHDQNVGGGQPVDGQISQRGRRIQNDDVILIQHPVRLQPVGQRLPQLPSPRGGAPDGNLEFGPIQVQLRADQINVGPMGFADDILGCNFQRLGQCLIKGQWAVPPRHAGAVLRLKALRVIARD